MVRGSIVRNSKNRKLNRMLDLGRVQPGQRGRVFGVIASPPNFF